MLQRLKELSQQYPRLLKEGRGRGLMIGMEFTSHELGYAVAKNLFERNILISGTYINAKVLRVEPPLVIDRQQIDQFLTALEQSLVAAAKEQGLAVAVAT